MDRPTYFVGQRLPEPEIAEVIGAQRGAQPVERDV
jgi:hypothetical protein